MMVCSKCGEPVDARAVKEGVYLAKKVDGWLNGRPEDCYPAEWVDVCPECGAEDSFEEVREDGKE